ncbi:MAG: CPBP family intramembrane metalloprotease [Micropruina sp.]|nr:CPBP family intramembrane metalloprotease [Micropruina sp.]
MTQQPDGVTPSGQAPQPVPSARPEHAPEVAPEPNLGAPQPQPAGGSSAQPPAGQPQPGYPAQPPAGQPQRGYPDQPPAGQPQPYAGQTQPQPGYPPQQYTGQSQPQPQAPYAPQFGYAPQAPFQPQAGYAPPAGYAPQPTFTPVGMPPDGHPWLPQQPVAGPSVLPVEPRQYHEFLRTPAMRWWRPIAALAMGGALWFLANMVLGGLAVGYDVSVGNTTWADYSSIEGFKTTPAFFLANNLALAAAIPIAALTQWACFGQRPRWMASVMGGFRWRWFLECVAWLLPLYLISLLVDLVFGGLPTIEITATTGFMIATILLTTPLQAAGEEYLLRGLGQRAIAAWLPRTAGLVISTAVTALIFMGLHGAGDPWLNVFYLLFATTASVLAWRTGGLEAAVAMHAVNNVVSMTFLPFTDITDLFDREAGVGSPWMLVQMVIMLAGAALVLWRAKRRNVVTMTAPGATQPPVPWQPQPMPQATPMQQPWRPDDAEQTR